MASELKAQEVVHSLEHGKGRWWVMFGLIVATAAVLLTCFLFIHVFRAALKQNESPFFRGLSHGKGMEQAVIARELARGNGFSTKVIKPAAIQLWEDRKGDGYFSKIVSGLTESKGNIPDIYHAPLNPWINSIALRGMIAFNNTFKWHKNVSGEPDFWAFGMGELVHIGDKTIAGVAILFFFGALIFNYFTITWLFDRRLAVIVVVMLLLCQHFWEFATTGLPQLLLLCLFSGATMCLTKGLMARNEGTWSWPWIAGAGAFFGLMMLAHGITVWVFIAAVIYVGLSFRPFGLNAGIMAAVALAFFVPWLVRNSNVCGDFKGLAWATKTFQLRGSESQIMRTLKEPDENIQPTNYLNKLISQTEGQMDHLYEHLGKIPTALFFFLALLHAFRKNETRSLRWGLLLMWLFAIFGMSFYGYSDYELLASLQANDVHLIFIPLFSAYGLALLLNMWSRVEVEGRLLSTVRFANTALTSTLIIIGGLPLFARYISPQENPIVFPPYYPPHLVRISQWYTEKDVICSDMPWGVAWYSDRKSLWLPLTQPDFLKLNSFTFNERISCILLTPVTGFRGLLSEVGAGEFREWAGFIMRDPRFQRRGFPLAVYTQLNIAGAPHYCIYSDRDRWTERQ
jgi:hypothetical protein